jgi:hypothetical protein
MQHILDLHDELIATAIVRVNVPETAEGHRRKAA